jgi:hypothetical protein
MKKYLKTFEDIEALRNTDAKIYCDSEDGYLQFVNGWPCWFFQDGNKLFGGGVFLSSNPYIEVPDEPDESWVGKLGWVSYIDSDDKARCGVLKKYCRGHEYPYKVKHGACWRYFTPLTPEEVEKYTGYKVVKED